MSGLYSSHSPGRCGRITSVRGASTFTSIACAVTAFCSEGAESCATTIDMTIRTTMITRDCQRKIVSENGMTPVICNSGLGRLAGFACSWAADELKPSAQVAPTPR